MINSLSQYDDSNATPQNLSKTELFLLFYQDYLLLIDAEDTVHCHVGHALLKLTLWANKSATSLGLIQCPLKRPRCQGSFALIFTAGPKNQDLENTKLSQNNVDNKTLLSWYYKTRSSIDFVISFRLENRYLVTSTIFTVQIKT